MGTPEIWWLGKLEGFRKATFTTSQEGKEGEEKNQKPTLGCSEAAESGPVLRGSRLRHQHPIWAPG